MNNPHIVILGAGYGGIITTTRLQRALGINEASITLVNKHDYHYQTTWLHENAAGTRHHDQTRIPIQEVVDLSRVKFVQDTVLCIKPDIKKVKMENHEFNYDILVVGLGFEAATYDIPGLSEHAFMIGDINSSRLLRDHLDYQFALYHNEKNKTNGRLTIAVGGAGFTGVEFIGELANRIPELCKEYDIDQGKIRVVSLEEESTIMPKCDRQLAEYAQNLLVSRGVEFITDASVKECQSDKIMYEKDGVNQELPTLTTVWAAGVRANQIVEKSRLETRHGKVEVRDDLRAPDHDNVFVVGDCALIWDKTDRQPYPSTAQIAVQEAETAAHNIKALVRGNDMTAFVPDWKGTVVSLGHDDAVGIVFKNTKIFGWKATFLKKFIDNRYLLKLGGFGLMMRKGKFNIFH